MKETFYKVTYKYKINQVPMNGETNIRWNGFEGLLDVEKEIKKFLKKFPSFRFQEIVKVEKIQVG